VLQFVATLLTAWLLAAVPPFPFPGTLTLLGVVVIALAFGAGPSLVAALLGSALLLLLVLPHPWGWLLVNVSAFAAVGVLSTIAIVISVLVSRTEHAHQEAVAATQARDTFLLLAAHELRTPLTAYMGLMELVLRRVQRLAEWVRQRRLEVVPEVEATADLLVQADAAVERQSHLVDELLDTSRIQAGTLTLQFAPR
jgi:signal transduction histidine kinase